MPDKTVKNVQQCNHEFTITFRSINKKVCRLCKASIDWKLKEGQKPLITSSKDRGL